MAMTAAVAVAAGSAGAADSSGDDGAKALYAKQLARVLRQGKDAKVLMSGFAGTDGVSFTPNYERLWVSEYTGMREDLLTLQETIKIKQDLGAPEMGGTNLAIKPAYLVVGGQAGGFVYTFPTLAKG